MKLEIAEFPVTQIRLSGRFAYKNRTLEVDEAALIALVREDPRITNATLAVAAPGENTRVTGIRDIVEPRFKVSGSGQVFPGVLGAVENVGDGRTHRLSGMTVIAAAEYEGTIRAGTTVQRSAILDMSGPGAEISRFSSYVHLVLSFTIAPGLAELDAHGAIQSAECKVASRLAQCTEGLPPARISIYNLSGKNPELPTVMLVQGCITDPQHVHSGVGYYGLSLRDSMATFVHPNELFDGAVTVDTTRSGRGYYPTTWDWQNHPLVLGLYEEHGKSLNFSGVVFQRIRFETNHGKEVGAQNAARLAKAMGADGVLVTWIGGGNAFVDVMFTVRACEKSGVKTVLVTYENGGKEGTDSPVLFYLPEADAVVSTGALDRTVDLPAMAKVIGPYEHIKIFPFPGAAPVPAGTALSLEARDVMIGGADIWGDGSFRCEEF
ncbi:MAG TPA: glycine/sarcosine/betaine reductase component B subunit [Candidatus Limnocylindria bacterium]|nr:glycine/sarcosine/betaine reductase component B subunit [Candidatus Limnocylindria bacterium]